MIFYFAPMEGITGHIYRRLHNELFGGAAKYYAPFIAPDAQGSFKATQRKDLLPENNEGLTLVPQLLANNAHAFYAASRSIAELGYKEINLNVGCPSGTVTAKHKGAGMLADLRTLDDFLADVFSLCEVGISVKTRLGMEHSDEFEAILELYNKYPITELTIHARARSGMYKSTPDLAAFARAAKRSRAPVVYNGNIFSQTELDALTAAAPETDRVMLGRGAVCDPALMRSLSGGAALQNGELRELCGRAFDELASRMGGHNATARLKELWYYMIYMYPDSEKLYKTLNKSKTPTEYLAAAEAIFASGCFDAGAKFGG